MAAIDISDYQVIAQKYADAQAQLSDVTQPYFDVVQHILNINVLKPELDLLAPFNSAYQSVQTVFLSPPSAVIVAVSALQRHVLDQARKNGGVLQFTDINDWIDAAGTNSVGTNVGRHDDTDISFKVAQEFADLSDQAGYTILSGNIDPAL